MLAKKLHHGGDRDWAKAHFSYTGSRWLDLSTGINPAPYPVPVLAPDSYHRLPEASALRTLKQAAADYYGAPHPDHLAAGPGSQALIQWLPRLRAPGRVAILAPTYQEHGHSWKTAGHEVREFNDLALSRAANPDVIIIVHPNNPTGQMLGADLLLETAREMADRGGWLVLDEAFGDVTPDYCLDREAATPGLVILRSFGKFFGLAGIRLGIAVTQTDLAERLETAMGLWTVPGPTLEIAAKAYGDKAWITATRTRLAADTLRLDGMLEVTGCRIVGGTHLFRLIESDRAGLLLNHLGDNGIMIRPFEYNVNWLRFGLPHGDEDWAQLEAALNSFT